MKRPVTCAFAALLFLVLLAGCKGDPDKTKETLEAYAEAVIVHRAPYQAYVHLDPEDKAHLSVEAYVSGFEEREKAFPPGTTVTVGDVSIQGDLARSTVRITPPEKESETHEYVLRRDGTKWRVWLGLAQRDQMREKLDEARRLADDGALEEAKEKLEEVATANFKASRPEIIEDEVAELREAMTKRQRFAQLDARLKEAMKSDLDKMQQEASELSRELSPEDEELYPRLQALQQEVRTRTKQNAIANFTVEDVRARSFRDAWGKYREVRFKATNNTGRPISSLDVRVDLENEGADDPVSSVVWQVVEEGSTVAPGEVLEVKRELDKTPDDWDGKEVAVTVEDLEFADGDGDDAG